MECTNCRKITRDNFKKEILTGQKRTRYDLVFLILNILHQTHSSGGHCCYCNKKWQGKCKMCVIPLIFSDFEKDIETYLM